MSLFDEKYFLNADFVVDDGLELALAVLNLSFNEFNSMTIEELNIYFSNINNSHIEHLAINVLKNKKKGFQIHRPQPQPFFPKQHPKHPNPSIFPDFNDLFKN